MQKNLHDFSIDLKIKGLLKLKKVTHQEFADIMGITRQTVANWLNGRTKLDVETIIDICIKLDTPFSYFLPDDLILKEGGQNELKTLIEQLERANRKKDFIINTFRMFFYNQNPELSKVVEKSMEELRDEDF
ncbi:MAG: helix-turn-helix transcriptional regulator [Bacteroidales bacterium]|jgi:transcriptional regulator with XRE-family HTH domain|nr:helix-turn-helix transcriptional regulator [Bacteroidales bacterium]